MGKVRDMGEKRRVHEMPSVQILWFHGCPGHAAARALLDDVIKAVAPGTPVESIDASDPAVAAAVRFPGSPTIRVDGRDIEPGFMDPDDYAPRCRLYRTPDGRLSGVPPREWIERALTEPRCRQGVASESKKRNVPVAEA